MLPQDTRIDPIVRKKRLADSADFLEIKSIAETAALGMKPIYQNSVISAPASDAVYMAKEVGSYTLPTTAGTQTITVTAAEVDPAGDYDRVELRYNKVADTWTKVAVEKNKGIDGVNGEDGEDGELFNPLISQNKIGYDTTARTPSLPDASLVIFYPHYAPFLCNVKKMNAYSAGPQNLYLYIISKTDTGKHIVKYHSTVLLQTGEKEYDLGLQLQKDQTIGFIYQSGVYLSPLNGRECLFINKSSMLVGNSSGYCPITFDIEPIYLTEKKQLGVISDTLSSVLPGTLFNMDFASKSIVAKKIFIKAGSAGTVNIGIAKMLDGVYSSRDSVTYNVVAGLNRIDVDIQLNANETVAIFPGGTATIDIAQWATETNSFYKDGSVVQGWVNIAVQYDEVIDLQTLKPIVKSLTPSVMILHPEDYGAEVINRFDPDNSVDCTDAFNIMLYEAIIKNTEIDTFQIEMRGIYRVGKLGTNYYQNTTGQIVVPRVNYMQRTKTLYFKGLSMPTYEDQGLTPMPNQISGCGFYSTLQPGSFGGHFVFGSQQPEGGSIWKDFNYVGIKMDDIAVYVKSENNGVSFGHKMTALDLKDFHMVNLGDILCRTTTNGFDLVEPHELSYGLRLPKFQNHAMVTLRNYRGLGFGVGLETGEHLDAGYVVVALCKIGVLNRPYYPCRISTLCCEMNIKPIAMDSSSYLSLGVFQVEEYYSSFAGAKWYEAQGNHISKSNTNNSDMRLTADIVVVHRAGGSVVPLTVDNGISYRYLMDEYGNAKLS